MSTTPSAYERGRAEGEAALRASLLDVASDLLVNEGSEALTMRRVAEAAGCSTTVLYRLFAGKQGILRGLYREGFDRLEVRLATVDEDDPLLRLRGLALAYRDHALTEPAYYTVMFARPVPEFEPSAEDVEHGRASLQVLVDAVAVAADAGRVTGADPQHIAEVLWAAAHGAVSLELAGHLDDEAAARTFSDLTTAALAGFLSDDTRA
jgi:AcrR family transcriptional regulator